jgi:hypothetical protein
MRIHGALLRSPDDGANFVGSYQIGPTFQAQFASTAGITSYNTALATGTSGRAASFFDGTNVGSCINSTCVTQAKGAYTIANYTNPLAFRVGAYSTTNGNIDGVATRLCFEPNSPTRCR